MSELTPAEVWQGLEKWLKTRRDEAGNGAMDYQAGVIDNLLDEVRDCGVEGSFPWERL